MDVSVGIIDKWKDMGAIRDMCQCEWMKGRKRGMQWERGGKHGAPDRLEQCRKSCFFADREERVSQE